MHIKNGILDNLLAKTTEISRAQEEQEGGEVARLQEGGDFVVVVQHFGRYLCKSGEIFTKREGDLLRIRAVLTVTGLEISKEKERKQEVATEEKNPVFLVLDENRARRLAPVFPSDSPRRVLELLHKRNSSPANLKKHLPKDPQDISLELMIICRKDLP